MTSRDLRGLIQIPDKAFFDSRRLEKKECRKCNKLKNIIKINDGVCNICINRLLK